MTNNNAVSHVLFQADSFHPAYTALESFTRSTGETRDVPSWAACVLSAPALARKRAILSFPWRQEIKIGVYLHRLHIIGEGQNNQSLTGWVGQGPRVQRQHVHVYGRRRWGRGENHSPVVFGLINIAWPWLSVWPRLWGDKSLDDPKVPREAGCGQRGNPVQSGAVDIYVHFLHKISDHVNVPALSCDQQGWHAIFSGLRRIPPTLWLVGVSLQVFDEIAANVHVAICGSDKQRRFGTFAVSLARDQVMRPGG